MSDDDEWENSDEYGELYDWLSSDEVQKSTPLHRPTEKKAKQSTKASDLKLDFCTDKSPERILAALENPTYYQTGELVNLVNFLFSKDNSDNDVWQSFKSYHANLLAYQMASGIGDGSITDVRMVAACYKICVTILQNSVANEAVELKFGQVITKTVYHQWVSKETPGEMKNLNVMFRFLREKDARYSGVGGVGKLLKTV